MTPTFPVPFRGAATALITPFSDGAPDLAALGRLIETQIASGIDALVLCGTTGEAPTLTGEEHRTLVRFAKERIAGRVPLIVGSGTNDTVRSLQLSLAAKEEGADALLLVTPYYNKGNEDGLFSHFRLLSSSLSLPLLLYDVPGRTANPLTCSLLDRLASLPEIVGIKEAGGNPGRILSLRARYGDRFALYCGSDEVNYPALTCGAAGLISVLSNVLPAPVKRLCTLTEEGDTDRALSLALALLPLTSALFADVNPIPVKALAARLGLCEAEYRLPLSPPTPALTARLEEEYQRALSRCAAI